MNVPDYIILHTLAFDGEADIERVRRWHLDRGWNDVGYHYLIRRSGALETGRKESEEGAHAMGYNSRSIGIAFEGHGDHEMWTLPQVLQGVKLCDRLSDLYGIPPHNILGHRETGDKKTCPGTKIDMDAFRPLFFHCIPEDV